MFRRNCLPIALYWLPLMGLAISAQEASAAPALDEPFVLTQPDGRHFVATHGGDEWANWVCFEGWLIVQGADGSWYYAKSMMGELVPTSTRVLEGPAPLDAGRLEEIGSTDYPAPSPRGPFAPDEETLSLAPSAPTEPLLVILVEFQDRQFQTSESAWATAFFGSSGNTVRTYYEEVSAGGFHFEAADESFGTANDGVVTVTLGYNHPSTGQDTDDRNRQVVHDALVAADPFVNFASFDADSSGGLSASELHAITVIAGYERSYSGSYSPSVWAHRSSLGWGSVSAPNLDGVFVCNADDGSGYAQEGELHDDHMATIGISCHELGHDIGLPDLYDKTPSPEPDSFGIGAHGLMGAGNWGAAAGEEPGATPTHMCAWSKMVMGFVTVVTIASDGSYILYESASPSYKVLKVTAADPNQYFLVENRQLSGFDAGLHRWFSGTSGGLGGGLAIWHIDEAQGNNDDENHKMVDLEEANGGDLGYSELDTKASRGNRHHYWYSGHKTHFGDTTSPNSRLYDGSSSCVDVSNVSASGSTMTAYIVVDITPPVCSFTWSPTTPTEDEEVGFDGTSSYDPDGTIVSWGWDFGDGNSGSGSVPSHSYAAAGTYTVTCTVTDNDGSTSSCTAQVTVNALPQPTFSIVSITPNWGTTGTVHISDLAGTGFEAGATVKLSRQAQPDIPATNVAVVSSTRITCDFDITGATTGAWDVVVTNPSGETATLLNGFVVEPLLEGGTDPCIAVATDGTVHIAHLHDGLASGRPSFVKYARVTDGAWSYEDIIASDIGTRFLHSWVGLGASNKVHIGYVEGWGVGCVKHAEKGSSWTIGTVECGDSKNLCGRTGMAMAVNGSTVDFIYEMWRDAGYEDGLRRARKDTSWSYGWLVLDGFDGSCAALADASGNLHVVYALDDDNLYYQKRTPIGWQSRELVHADIGGWLGGRPGIAVDSAGNVHLTYAGDLLGNNPYYASNVGGSWTVHGVIDDSADCEAGFARIACGPDDTLHAAYHDQVTETLRYAVYDGASWSITELGHQDDFGGPDIAVDRNGTIHIAYGSDWRLCYIRLPMYEQLTIAAIPPTGGTTIPAPGTHSYAHGSQVSLTALPNPGWEFDRWSGDASGTSPTTVVTMDGPKSVIANFAGTAAELTCTLDLDVMDACTGEYMARVRPAGGWGEITCWIDWLDGSPPSSCPPEQWCYHVYGYPGCHSAVATVTDEAGQTANSREETLCVDVWLLCDFTFGPTQPMVGENIQFTSTVQEACAPPPFFYFWDFGDGATSNEEHPTHSYAAAGTYQVELLVIDDHARDATCQALLTVLSAPPACGFVWTPATPTEGEQANFDGTESHDPDGTIVSWAWDFGDGTSGSGPTVSHTYAAAGTYTVSLTVTDDEGAISECSRSIFVQFICAPGVITTVAGGGSPPDGLGDGGPATIATLASPFGLAAASDGTLCIGDVLNCRIRKVGPDGIITTVAGNGIPGYSGDGGPATDATLDSKSFGVAAATDGSLYVADGYNHRIRKVDFQGIITTVAGNGEDGYSGDGGPAIQATLSHPWAVAVGSDGSLYVADVGNHTIRRVRDGIITTVAGNGTAGYSGDGGPATEARLDCPEGVAVCADGTFYIADTRNHRIRKVGPDDIITTVAGGGSPPDGLGDGGPATEAMINNPRGLATSADCNVYIAEYDNHRVRKVDSAGVITTIAGNGQPGYSGDGGPATVATLKFPTGLATGADGSVCIADCANNRIRRVCRSLPPACAITYVPASPVAGQPVDFDSNATDPEGAAIVSGHWTFGDGESGSGLTVSHTYASSGSYTVTCTVADEAGETGSCQVTLSVAQGLTAPGNFGPGDKTPDSVTWSWVDNCLIEDGFRVYDEGDNLKATAGPDETSVVEGGLAPNTQYTRYVVAYNLSIGESAASNQATAYTLPMAPDVTVDLPMPGPYPVGTNFTFTNLAGFGPGSLEYYRIVWDTDPIHTWTDTEEVWNSGTLQVSSSSPGSWYLHVNSYNAAGESGGTLDYGPFLVNAPPACGLVWTPATPTEGEQANFDGTESYDPDGTIVSWVWDFGDGTSGSGPITSHTYAAAGTYTVSLTVTDNEGATSECSQSLFVQFVCGAGVIITVAGDGRYGYSGDGGPATQASLFSPAGVAAADGSIYIADTENHRIRKMAPTGIITTVAGNGECGYSGDGGPGALACLNHPGDVAAGQDGSLYIADSGNARIRKVDPDGIITTVAGTGEHTYSGDGDAATDASLYYPEGVTVDADGCLYIADTGNCRIRKVCDGVISTVAGNGECRYCGDGGPATLACLNHPEDVAVSEDGTLYIADQHNHRIREINTVGMITTVAGNGEAGYSGDGGAATQASLNNPTGVAVGAGGNIYIADLSNNRIRSVDPNGTIVTVAGNGVWDHSGDGGLAAQASLVPLDLAVGADGWLYIATAASRIRKVCGGHREWCISVTGASWHMVTLPWLCTDRSPWAVFDELVPPLSPLDMLSGCLHRYDHEGQRYVTYYAWAPSEFGPITAGDGYWLWVETPTTICYHAIWPVEPVTVYFRTRGWHLFGSPRTEDVPIAACTVHHAGEALPFADAANVWLQDPLFGYDPGTSQYVRCGVLPIDADHCLRAFHGYWVYTFVDDVTLVFPWPPPA